MRVVIILDSPSEYDDATALRDEVLSSESLIIASDYAIETDGPLVAIRDEENQA